MKAEIDSKALNKALKKAKRFIDKKSACTNNILLDFQENKLVVVSTDSVTLYKRHISTTGDLQGRYHIPTYNIMQVIKFESQDTTTIFTNDTANDTVLQVLHGSQPLQLPISEWSFPDYAQVMPEQQPHQTISIDTKDWKAALNQLKKTYQKGDFLTISLKRHKITLSTVNADATVRGVYNTRYIKAMFNFQKALKIVNTFDIKKNFGLQIVGERKPCTYSQGNTTIATMPAVLSNGYYACGSK